MQHDKNDFYFEFINESKVFLLIYNSDLIKSYEWVVNFKQVNFLRVDTSYAIWAPQTISVSGLLNPAIVWEDP